MNSVVPGVYPPTYGHHQPISAPPISKIGNRPILNLEKLTAICSAQVKPIYALGGITPANASLCRQTGASGMACIGSVWGASEPVEAVRELLQAWESSSPE